MLYIIILIIILLLILYYLNLLYTESIKLKSNDSNNTYCDNYINNKYECPYNRNACTRIKKQGYSELLCMYDESFLKNFNIFKLFRGGQDVYNSVYFIEKDTRKIKFLKCNNIINLCEFNGKDIIIKNDGIMRISKESDTEDYYIYTPYNFFISFMIDIVTNKQSIETADDLLKKINEIEIIDCSNLTKEQLSSVDYQTTCIFNKITNLDAIDSTFNTILFKHLNKNIFIELDSIFKDKTEMTLIEYLLYVSSNNFINGNKFKLKFLKK